MVQGLQPFSSTILRENRMWLVLRGCSRCCQYSRGGRVHGSWRTSCARHNKKDRKAFFPFIIPVAEMKWVDNHPLQRALEDELWGEGRCFLEIEGWDIT